MKPQNTAQHDAADPKPRTPLWLFILLWGVLAPLLTLLCSYGVGQLAYRLRWTRLLFGMQALFQITFHAVPTVLFVAIVVGLMREIGRPDRAARRVLEARRRNTPVAKTQPRTSTKGPR